MYSFPSLRKEVWIYLFRMDQNNEKPVKESVFLAEVTVKVVVNLTITCCCSQFGFWVKYYHMNYLWRAFIAFFFQKRKYASSLGSTSNASSSPKSSPDTSPQHSRWLEFVILQSFFIFLFFLQPKLQWIGLLKLMILHLIRLLWSNIRRWDPFSIFKFKSNLGREKLLVHL